MNESDFSNALRSYSKDKLSPTLPERKFVSTIYGSFQDALNNNCIQIGSFSRFTAIRPLHDLDILYIDGEFDKNKIKPDEVLDALRSKIRNNLNNSTKYKIKIEPPQSHSITINFIDNEEEIIFSVDVIPAFLSGETNEFNQDIYVIPELVNIPKRERTQFYEKLKESKKSVQWIKSDPRGYQEEAKKLNDINDDFRKAAKILKAWKNSCKEKDDTFKLKSFHIEQAIVNIFKQDNRSTIFTAIFKFFCDLPDLLKEPQFKDRADQNRFIDEYINNLSRTEEQEIIEARDYFLITLENLSNEKEIENLFSGINYERKTTSEQYLFDFKIPTLLDENIFLIIDGLVLQTQGHSAYYLRNKNNEVGVNRNIDFMIISTNSDADYYKWKVKNDDNSPEPRGEINDHNPTNNPESTKYIGNHYVECYAIKNNVCIAKARRPVIIK